MSPSKPLTRPDLSAEPSGWGTPVGFHQRGHRQHRVAARLYRMSRNPGDFRLISASLWERGASGLQSAIPVIPEPASRDGKNRNDQYDGHPAKSRHSSKLPR